MREAISFYRQVQRQYVWLHIIFGVLLMSTAVFWFIVPLFIICYGMLDMTSVAQMITFCLLFAVPALVASLHCVFISYRAAQQWSMQVRSGRLRWFIIFQLFSFFVALTFTTTMYILFIVIDLFR